MKGAIDAVFCAAAFSLGALNGAVARERSEIPDRLKWDLRSLYASHAAWENERLRLGEAMALLKVMKGHLGDSPETLLAALDAVFSLRQRVEKLHTYALQRFDEDTRLADSAEMRQSAEQIYVELGSATSWLKPELLALGEGKVRELFAAEPKLQTYAFFLRDTLRWQPHTLSVDEEKIVAEAGHLKDAGHSVYSVLTNSELPYPRVQLSSGETIELNAAAYTKYRASCERVDRERVFEAFFGVYQGFARTLATTLHARLKAHAFDRNVHKFGSSLEAALFCDNIPVSVYKQLVADVHRSLPVLHRYLKLRKRLLGVKELRYSDLYAPIVKTVERLYSPEEAMTTTLDALAPLGKNYGDTLKRGFENRWVDFLPSTGKRTGAYCSCAYGVHPYQLLNFMGRFDDVSTLAHESGHAMHSYLANRQQPYVNAGYATFIAEIASTLNEDLLVHHLLATTTDDATRLYLLGGYLEHLRQTLFRQALLAEFELEIHERVDHGQALSDQTLNSLYLGLLRQYYGDAQGVCKVDDKNKVEWAYIPHMYYGFYVYQYATSVVAATSIASAMRSEHGKGLTQTRDAFLALLAAGGSDYPLDLLRQAGVDMTTSQPFSAAMTEMGRVMDEIEALVARDDGAARR